MIYMVQTKVQKIFFALGTVNTLTVFSDGLEDVLLKAKNRVYELHNKLSAFDENSEVSQINKSAGVCPVKVSDDTLRLIERSVSYSKQTNGMFDITIHTLSMLWKKCIAEKALPSKEQVEKRLYLTNYRDILIDRKNKTVMLRLKNQAIDLGGVAKGYAADEVRRIFLEENIDEAIINLGGTVITIGETRKIGIQNPYEKTGTAFGSLGLHNKAVVSSGLYEQGFTLNGKTYHHIINPKTGYPAGSDLAGVTLIGDSAEELDALSTTALMSGMNSAAGFLGICGIEAVFITKGKKVYTTNGLAGQLGFC